MLAVTFAKQEYVIYDDGDICETGICDMMMEIYVTETGICDMMRNYVIEICDICDGDISAIKCMNSSVSNSSTIKAKSAGLTQDISSN